MTPAQLWNNIVAYALQVGLLVALGAIIPPVLKLRTPRAKLLFWQAILASCILLPWIQPWRQQVIDISSVKAITAIESEETASASATTATPVTQANTIARPIPFTAILLCALAAGVVIRIALLILGLIRLAGYRRRGRQLDSDPVFRIATPTTARWLVSDEISSPVTFGWRDPVVLLPSRFPKLRAELREVILCHELIHIERRDWMFTVAEELARAMFWFHPAVWWVLGEIQLAREQTVDRSVMEITSCVNALARDRYIDALLTMATSTSPAENQLDLAPAPLFLRRRHLKRRVVELLQEIRVEPVSRLRTLMTQTTAIAALATGCWLVSGAFPLDATPQLVADAAGVVVNTGGAKLLYRTPVLYPDEALENGVQGTVVVDAVVDRSGRLSDGTVVHCVRELCGATHDSLLNWRFAANSSAQKQQILIGFLRPPGSFAAPVDDPEQDELAVSRWLAQQLSRPKHPLVSQLYARNIAPVPPASSAVPTFNARVLLLNGNYVITLVPDQAYGKTLNAIRIAGLSDSSSQLLSRLPVRPGDVWSPAIAAVVNQIVKDFAPGLEVDILKTPDPASQLETLWIGPSWIGPSWIGPSFPAPAAHTASYADVTPPAVILKVDPAYTESAKLSGTSGTVVLTLTVSPEGTAQDIRVVSPLDPGLDAAAMSVVPRWHFKPGQKNGAPVAVPVQIDFTFRVL